MAETLDPENAAFWLPSSFLTDDDDKKDNNNDDFLFGFDPHSPVSSTQTERGDSTNDNDNDDDDFIAELTRNLAHSSLHDSLYEKPWNLSTSPQSTLTGFGPLTKRSGFSSNGSPNGPSPPLTPPPKNDAAWDLLYEAAGQVARLKIKALAAEMYRHHHYNNLQNRGLLGTPRDFSLSSKPFHHNSLYEFPQFEQVKRQGNGNFYCNNNHNLQHQQRRSCNGGPIGLPHTAWPPLRPNNHHAGPAMRPVFHNGPMPGIKRQSTGTGVFLPRRAGTTTQQPPEPPRIKPTGFSPMWSPDALDMELEELNKARFGSATLSQQEIIMARRDAVMEQQRRSFMRNDEISLPTDWTY